MKQNKKQQLKSIANKHLLLKRDDNFISKLHNILLLDKVDDYSYEINYKNLTDNLLQTKIIEDISNIFNKKFENKEIKTKFFVFFNELMNYFNNDLIDNNTEYKILLTYSDFAETLKSIYRTNFNELILHINKTIYITQKGLK